MFNFLQRFTILRDPIAGVLALMVLVTTFISVTIFQEAIALPKLVTFFILIGAILLQVAFFKKDTEIKLPKIALVLLGSYTLFLLVGLFFSKDVVNSIFGLFPRFSNSAIFAISWVVLILILGSIRTKYRNQLLYFFVVLGFVSAIWGILQSFGIGYYAGLTEGVRNTIPGFLGNPNFSAMFLVTTIPLVTYYLLNSKTKLRFYLHLAMLGTSLVAIVLFNSRGAYLALIVVALGIIAALLYLRKYLVFLVALLVSGTLLFTMYSFYQSSRVDVPISQQTTSEDTVNTRFLVWDSALNQIIKQPLFGTGSGNYFLAFRENTNSALANKEWFDDTHNVVLQLYVTLGVFAASTLLLLIGYVVYWAGRRFVVEKDQFSGYLLLSIIAWFAAGSFTPVSPTNWIFLAFILSVALSLQLPLKSFKIKGYYKFIPGTIGVFLILLGVLMLISELFLWQAKSYAYREDFPTALKLSKISQFSFPYNTNASLLYSQTLINSDLHSQASSEIQKSVILHPYSSGVYLAASQQYLNLYLKTRDQQYANYVRENTNQMIAFNRNYAPVYRVAALNMFSLDDYNQAKDYVIKAYVLGDHSFGLWLIYTDIHLRLNDKDGAIFGIEQAFKIHPAPELKSLKEKIEQSSQLEEIKYEIYSS